MPFILPAIGAAIAAMTVVEIVIVAAVLVTTAIALKGAFTGVKSAPVAPGSSYQTNPLTLTISADAPRRMVYGKARISGVLAYINVSGEGHEYLHMVIVVAAHRIKTIKEIYFDGKPGPDVAAGYYDYTFYNGQQTTADAGLMNLFPEWTADCILQGCAYAIVRLKYDKTVWANGRPNVTFDVEGKDDIYDPRDGLSKFTNNWALCVADYLTHEDGVNALWSEVDEPSVEAAADISDQLPPEMAASLCDGRYTVDGVIELSQKNGDVLKAMMAAGAGTIIYTEGMYRIYAGAMRAPVARAITTDDLRDSLSLQPRTPTDQSFNCVKGTFLDSTAGWVFSDFPPIVAQEYIDQDGGERVFHDIVLQFTTSPITAQKLATIFLRRARLEKTINLLCKWTVFNYEVWDVVPLNLPQLNMVDSLFQITDWKMVPPQGKNPGGINLTLVEYHDDIYSDDITLKPIQGAGTILVPNITTPNPLSVLYATSSATTTNANGEPQIRFDWPISPDIYAVGYEIAYGKYPFVPVDADYQFVAGKNTGSLTVGPLTPGDVYIGYVRVVNSYDRRSTETASNVVTVQAVGAGVPGPVTGFAAALVGTEYVDLTWVAPSGSETQTEIRWAATNDINASVAVTRIPLPTNTTRLTREGQAGYYFAAFINAGGNYGPFTAGVAVAARTTGTVLQTVGFSVFEGDLVNGVWVDDFTAVSKSQSMADALGWEVFDMMVPNPYPEVRYFRKAASFVANGDVRVSGYVGRSRAPGVPGTLPVLAATAEVAYFGNTQYKQGTFTLDPGLGSANIKTGFISNSSDAGGIVFTGFNGLLEDL